MAEVLSASADVDAIRARFSSLQRGFAFFDAPGGTQVPDEVGDAIALALREASANLGAGYATSIRVAEILEEAEGKAARFFGCEPREVIFGPNMTTLNFALSRTAARAFSPGDEILVSCLDHDAGCSGAEQLFGNGFGLFGRCCHAAARHRHAVFFENPFTLVLMNFHSDLFPAGDRQEHACG